MAKNEINVRQTITYDHNITVECEEEDIDDVMDRLYNIEQYAYGDFTEFIPEIEGSGEVTVTDTVEDGSGECEWEFDYEEV